jgi:sec-independent protein translocase protein TatA
MSVFGFNLPQGGELIVLLFIVLLIFGAKRLPEMGRSLGRGVREFKGGVQGLADDVKSGMKDDEDEAVTPERPNDAGRARDE